MLLQKRHVYKPLKYPFAFEAFHAHERMHWLPEDASLTKDVMDWANHINPGQKQFLLNLFRFFTQADISVASAYANKFVPMFSGNPEVAMMLLSFAAREGVHVHAYSLLIDTIGLPEREYTAFLEYAAMKDKYDFLENVRTDNHFELAKSMAIYSAFTEGMQLYASFVMLVHFENLGLMPGMVNVVRWSMADEALHANSMIKLFHAFCDEYLSKAEREALKPEIQDIARKMVDLEDKFIDLAFNTVSEDDLNAGLLAGKKRLTKEDIKTYIRHVADARLAQLGFDGCFGNPANPLRWVEESMGNVEFANFFETKPTEYSKGNLVGEITDWSF